MTAIRAHRPLGPPRCRPGLSHCAGRGSPRWRDTCRAARKQPAGPAPRPLPARRELAVRRAAGPWANTPSAGGYPQPTKKPTSRPSAITSPTHWQCCDCDRRATASNLSAAREPSVRG